MRKGDGKDGQTFMAGNRSSRVAVHHDLAELPEGARALLAERGREDLFSSVAWFELILRWSPPENRRLRLYTVASADGDQVDCVLVAAGGTRTDPAIGRVLASLTNFYTMRFQPILRPGLAEPGAALAALARAIAAERPRWDMINLGFLTREDPVTAQLVAAFAAAGLLVDTYFQYENWYQPTAGLSGERYFATRPSQLRNTVTRKSRKAEKEHQIAFRLYQAPEDIEAGIADYQRVYAKSWKGAEQYPDFIPNLLRHGASAGSLRLGIYAVDGVAVAAQIWLVTGKRAIIYKLAYDEDYATLSAGSILTRRMADHVLDVDHVAEIDYGIGSEAYKRDWMQECRHMVGLVAFNARSAHGLFGAARHFGGRFAGRLRGRTTSSGAPSSRAQAGPA